MGKLCDLVNQSLTFSVDIILVYPYYKISSTTYRDLCLSGNIEKYSEISNLKTFTNNIVFETLIEYGEILYRRGKI